MDEILPQPTLCVDIDSLYDGSYRNGSILNAETTETCSQELALVVRADKEICPLLSAGSTSADVVSRPLDLQQVDFLGSVEVVKKLFAMPYTDQRPLFAVHKMGNTLLLDSMTGHDTNPYDINFSHDDRGGAPPNYQGQNSSSERSYRSSAVDSNAEKISMLQNENSAFTSLDHLMTSSDMESILGKVTPLYLPAPSKHQMPVSKQFRGLLTNEESMGNRKGLERDSTSRRTDSIRGPHDCLIVEESANIKNTELMNFSSQGDNVNKQTENPSVKVPKGEPSDSDPTVPSEVNDIRSHQTHPAMMLMGVGNIARNSPALEGTKRDQFVAAGSPFIPPPNFFMPPVPPPAKQVLSWDLHEMRLALSSDLTVYRTEQHPAFVVKTLDITKKFELSTCLDFYLDNVMANVPEFALALHTKGFIRGIKLVQTSDIPYLNPVDLVEPFSSTSSPTSFSSSSKSAPSSSPSSSSSTSRRECAVSSDERNEKNEKNERAASNISSASVPREISLRSTSGDEWNLGLSTIRGEDSNARGRNDTDSNRKDPASVGVGVGVGVGGGLQEQPMFDPKVIDMDASTILRFLKANCRRDDGTYVLRQSTDGEALHLYDLGLASGSKQKQFKWMLAMLSYRFAIRLGHHIKIATPRCRVQIRQRQMHLFSSCYQLLREIKELGGEDHGTIRAAVLEQMADAHLSRVDDFSVQGKKDSNSKNKESHGEEEDDEDFDQHTELHEAVQLLCSAVECLSALINKEIGAAEKDAALRNEKLKNANMRNENITSTVSTAAVSDSVSVSVSACVNNTCSVGNVGRVGRVTENKITSSGISPPLDGVNEDRERDSDEDDAEGMSMSGRGDIVETLAVQLAGVLHKLVQASLFMVMNCIRTAKISACLDCLSRLVVPCNLWSQLKFTILSSPLSNAQKRRNTGGKSDYYDTSDERDSEGLWGADMTIVQSLPILWDLTGEACREIAKQTSGVSLQDTDIMQRLKTLVLTWNRLTLSVLGDSAMIAHYNARPTQLDTADNSTHTIKVPPTPSPSPSSSPVPSNSPNPDPHPTQTSVPMGTSAIKRAKAKAKARAKINATEMCDEAPPLKDMLLAAKKSVTSRDWLMLSSSLPPTKTVQAGMAGMAGDGRSRRDIETEVPADPVAALCIIHSIVAPLVLRDTEHLKVLMQLKSYSSHTQSDSSSSSSCEGQGLEEIKSSCTVLTASVVRAVGGEKGVQDELTVSLLMTYCFLCAALMHHLKATGGVKRNAVDTDDTTDSSKKCSKKKTKSQRAERAGGTMGPVGLRVSDPSVRLCLRRLGDACNSISQRLLTHAASTVRLNSEVEVEVGVGGGGVDRPVVLEGMEGSVLMKDECAALAHRLFIASLTLFEAVGDVNNAAMVRCNLSSLLRSQATWEMAKCSSKSSQFNQNQNFSDVANSVYLKHYECSTRYLKEAQKHCALAVFDDTSTTTNTDTANNTTSKNNNINNSSSSSSRGSEGSIIDKISMQMKSAASGTRNAVALETAQTCLNLGMLRRGHLFRCYVHSPASPSLSQSSSSSHGQLQVQGPGKGRGKGDIGDVEKSEVSGVALTLGEKENSVVQYFETALELFYELKNYRQAAAAHYQLGSFYSNYWPLCPSRSDALLEKALLHYRESHGYYSKYDVGPTLLLILVDMCDLYLGAYSATEPYLLSSIRGEEKGKEREKVKEKEKSSDVYTESECNTSTQTPSHLSGNTTNTLLHVHVPPTTNANTMSDSISASTSDSKSSIESDSDLVVALLGGALQSLLESRFAFTPAVAERSRYRSQIISLAGEIAKRLGGVLVKVLKAHAKGHLPWPKTPTAATDSKVANTDSACDEKSVNLAMESQNTNLQSATLADLTGSGSVIHNGYRPNVKVNPNDTVLDVRRICVELLRWSVPNHTTPLSTPSPSSSPSLSTISVPLSPSSPLPSSTHYSICADVISVARLYELIDILNQNEWLRSCCSSSAK